MLMFQSGLLTTFIPEILMVIGYLFCLIAPGLKTDANVTELHTKNISQIIVTQQTYESTFITNINDFQTDALNLSDLILSPSTKFLEIKKIFGVDSFELSNGSISKQFTRPPPFCC